MIQNGEHTNGKPGLIIEPMLTREEVAGLFKVPPRTVDKMRLDGRLPFRKLGKHYRYPTRVVREMAENGCIVRDS